MFSALALLAITGLEKTGGRTKGTPDKSTHALREKLAALGCGPPQELLKLARDPKAEMGLQESIYYWVLRHTYPVPKAGGDALDEALSSESPITLEEAIKLARCVLERYDSDAQNSNAASSNANEVRPFLETVEINGRPAYRWKLDADRAPARGLARSDKNRGARLSKQK
jgi:hypothetical protein